ncbi:MAG: hypothetical protein ABI216_15950 [Devosia sp.]
MAGRVDAVILLEGKVLGVLDWKSDLKPSPKVKSHYVTQLDAYVAATGAVAGAVAFMASGELRTGPNRNLHPADLGRVDPRLRCGHIFGGKSSSGSLLGRVFGRMRRAKRV